MLDGLRAHHTFVSALPPAADGPRLFLEADGDGDGSYEAIAGSTTDPTSVFRVRAENAAPGSVVRVVTDQGRVKLPLNGASAVSFRPGVAGVPAATTYVRAELLVPDARNVRTPGCDPVVGSGTTLCRDDLLMEALTSPVFIR